MYAYFYVMDLLGSHFHKFFILKIAFNFINQFLYSKVYYIVVLAFSNSFNNRNQSTKVGFKKNSD